MIGHITAKKKKVGKAFMISQRNIIIICGHQPIWTINGVGCCVRFNRSSPHVDASVGHCRSCRSAVTRPWQAERHWVWIEASRYLYSMKKPDCACADSPQSCFERLEWDHWKIRGMPPWRGVFIAADCTYIQQVSGKSVEFEEILSGRISGRISGLSPKSLGVYFDTVI